MDEQLIKRAAVIGPGVGIVAGGGLDELDGAPRSRV